MRVSKKKIIQSYQRRFRHFTLAYKVALVAIALLCLTSAFVIHRASRPELSDAKVVNVAGQQRLYAYQIGQAIEDLGDRETPAEREATLESLRNGLARWKANQQLLLNVAARQHLTDLAANVRDAGAIFDSVDKIGRQMLDTNGTSRPNIRPALRHYLASQDVIIRDLLDYHLSKVDRLDGIQLTCAFLIILLLIVEGVWLYRPMLKGMQQSFERIEEHHREMDAIREQLAAQNENLRENENSLNAALDRAEDMSRLSRYSAARFEELFAGLPIATFTFDAEGTIFEWNRESESLFGIKAHRITGRCLDQAPSNPVNVDDYRAMIAKVFKGKHLYDMEQTIRRAGGEERIVLCNAFPFRGPEGTTTGGVCVMLDVTEARRESRRIAESETLFRTSMESLQSGILFMDNELKITKCNPRAAEIMGLQVEEVLGLQPSIPKSSYFREDGSIMQPDELPLLAAFHTRSPLNDSVMGIKRLDGTEVWISVNAAPVQLAGAGEPMGAVCSFTDITMFRQQRSALEGRTQELESANKKLEALATTDGLTNLNNHRRFQEVFEQAHARGMRSRKPLSLIMLDVDHFKRFNDVFGHPAGDEVLRRVAKALESVARASDLVARYGGEEFVIVLPDTDQKGAMEAAERFRSVIEDQDWPNQQVTASFGVATTVPNEFDREQLIAMADAALYASKKLGRNRCTHAESLKQVA